MKEGNIVVIGSGLGGLLSAAFLAKEGYEVTVLEKQKQIGGCLQNFSRDKVLFDSCVHYIGGLDKGNTLYKIFEYLEIMDHLELEPYDTNCFDQIIINGTIQQKFPIAQGYNNFIEQLTIHFPEDHNGLKKYVSLLQEVAEKFPLYRLKNGDAQAKMEVLLWNLKAVLDELFQSEELKQVLCGNALLYEGRAATTPFYVHALVCSSYIESSFKVKNGSGYISKYLWQTIQKYGGTIIRNDGVTKVIELADDSFVIHTNSGKAYHASKVISNIHPVSLFRILESNKLKTAFKQRVTSCRNSVSAFMVNIVFESEKVAYKKHNIYFNGVHPLHNIDQMEIQWPNSYALYFVKDKNNDQYASGLSILTYMHSKVFESDADTYNTTHNPSDRNRAYQQLKSDKGKELLAYVQQSFPEYVGSIKSWEAVTPLTFRDYMGSEDGSIYGMVADCNQPLMSQLTVQTKLPNLLMTGQNINMHGILGVAITAVATAGAIIGLDDLLEKINA